MSFVSFSLAVVFIIRLFSTSAIRVPKMSLFSGKLISMIHDFLLRDIQRCTSKLAHIFAFRPQLQKRCKFNLEMPEVTHA